MFQYKKRIADMVLKDKLSRKGAVLIEGTKWCGKTTTALQVAKSVLYMQNPQLKVQNIQMAYLDPGYLLEGNTPRLIDEWQLAPTLWDAVRFAVDQRNDSNQFILTGSSVPPKTDEISHSGVGRIVRMMMRPMSLFESGESDGSVSLTELFKGNTSIRGFNNLDLSDIAFLICRGGWPKTLDCDKETALKHAIDYFDMVISDGIRVDTSIRRSKLFNILRSIARNVSSQVKISSIVEDINSQEPNSISTPTVRSYIDALKQIFVIEDSLSWNPNLRSKTAIRTTNTRYFTDPSIGIACLGIGPQDLRNDLQTFGLFFENMCIRDLRIYADVLDGEVYHYRDKTGLECDAVIHLRNGSYGLVEIKLGGDVLIANGIKTLNKLAANIDTTKMPAPSFKMILTGTGRFAYKDENGILIVPIGCLTY